MNPIFEEGEKENRGQGTAGKVPVFGILERGGKVKVVVVGDVKGDLLELAIKKIKRDSLIYTTGSEVTTDASHMDLNTKMN